MFRHGTHFAGCHGVASCALIENAGTGAFRLSSLGREHAQLWDDATGDEGLGEMRRSSEPFECS